MPSASLELLDALQAGGVAYLFCNFGSDHPALVEALAEARGSGRAIPRLITCPNEMVALSAAQGFAQASGRAQAVIVHVDVGTQALGGAVHNVARARVPVLIYAGLSPATQHGELPGSRNEFIQWIQDVPDQRGIVRNYVKYENEIRTGRNLRQIVFRALQVAVSDPPGPVYLAATREAMEAEVPASAEGFADYAPVGPGALTAAAVEALAGALRTARLPLLVTSYVGRNPQAVPVVQRLARLLGMGVLESVPNHLNMPTDDPLYQGNQWNQPRQNQALADADLVLVVDSDVPWIPTVSCPSAGAAIHHIDVDPLKASMPLWHVAARSVHRADAGTALGQLVAALERAPAEAGLVARRAAHWAALHAARAEALRGLEAVASTGEGVTPEYLTAAVRGVLDAEAVVLNEGISNYHTVINHLGMVRPGSLLGSGGGSLGWHGGAAIGVKLAQPERTVVAMTGDGSYLFSQPSSVHWMARRYGTPFLTVIYNNRGWKSPKLSALALHPRGHASRANDLGVEFEDPPDYAGIAAAAGGALALRVRRPEEVGPALAAAMRAVREEGRCAVVDAWVPHL